MPSHAVIYSIRAAFYFRPKPITQHTDGGAIAARYMHTVQKELDPAADLGAAASAFHVRVSYQCAAGNKPAAGFKGPAPLVGGAG